MNKGQFFKVPVNKGDVKLLQHYLMDYRIFK